MRVCRCAGVQVCTVLQELVATFNALPGCAGAYTASWLARACLVSRARAEGLTGLPVAGVGVKLLTQLGPDQASWWLRLSRCQRGTARRSVSEILQAAGYTGPVELFSMWACIFSSPGATALPLDQLAAKLPELRAARATFRAVRKWEPHPASLLEEAEVSKVSRVSKASERNSCTASAEQGFTTLTPGWSIMPWWRLCFC